MKIKNILVTGAAAALSIMPIAAQAGTTAAASTISASKLATAMKANARKSATPSKKNSAEGNNSTLYGVAGVLAGVGAGCALWCGDDNKSKGS